MAKLQIGSVIKVSGSPLPSVLADGQMLEVAKISDEGREATYWFRNVGQDLITFGHFISVVDGYVGREGKDRIEIVKL